MLKLEINGKAVEFVVDTGATYISMGASDAARLGIDTALITTDAGAVVVTGPRGSFGVARTDGTPIGRMVTWQDRRAAGLVPSLIDQAGPGYRAVVGYQPTPSSVLPNTWPVLVPK